MSLPKKETKPITALDIFNAVVPLVIGFMLLIILTYMTDFASMEYSGLIILAVFGISSINTVRFIIKFLKQPVNRSEK